MERPLVHEGYLGPRFFAVKQILKPATLGDNFKVCPRSLYTAFDHARKQRKENVLRRRMLRRPARQSSRPHDAPSTTKLTHSQGSAVKKRKNIMKSVNNKTETLTAVGSSDLFGAYSVSQTTRYRRNRARW